MYKLIEYAYPTSTTAVKAGFGKQGCWFIGIYENAFTIIRASIVTNSYTNDKERALTTAESIPLPYHNDNKYFR